MDEIKKCFNFFVWKLLVVESETKFAIKEND